MKNYNTTGTTTKAAPTKAAITKDAPTGLLRVGVHSINLEAVRSVSFSGGVEVNFLGGGSIKFKHRVSGLSNLLEIFGLPALKEAPTNHPFHADAFNKALIPELKSFQ
ncbi:hypothetical protein [Rubritalea profundi]|uniref:Uncharacterized protein n=1 Tax=Rubritalea profundi TaxID=1658618 RepID=A0A2S7U0K4_9BACT|nr:hypothetical protein [Rubritalea profundi]PQJ27924.1 hypothetical protein BSZ32_05020 [Rubritalea profundi]